MIYNKQQNNSRDFHNFTYFFGFSANFLDRSPLGTRLDKDFSLIKGLGHLYPQFASLFRNLAAYPNGSPYVSPLRGPGALPDGFR